jgi:hypothetical protein
VKHLQDYCNKFTVIYSNGRSHDIEPLYDCIFERWSQGDVHRLDIEFGRFFAKLVRFEEETTTQQTIVMHETLINAS